MRIRREERQADVSGCAVRSARCSLHVARCTSLQPNALLILLCAKEGRAGGMHLGCKSSSADEGLAPI